MRGGWDGHYQGKQITVKEHLRPALEYLKVARGFGSTSKKTTALLQKANLGKTKWDDTLDLLQLGRGSTRPKKKAQRCWINGTWSPSKAKI